jgi:hypothetical protein
LILVAARSDRGDARLTATINDQFYRAGRHPVTRDDERPDRGRAGPIVTMMRGAVDSAPRPAIVTTATFKWIKGRRTRAQGEPRRAGDRQPG